MCGIICSITTFDLARDTKKTPSCMLRLVRRSIRLAYDHVIYAAYIAVYLVHVQQAESCNTESVRCYFTAI